MKKKKDKDKKVSKTFKGLDALINNVRRENRDVLLPEDVFKTKSEEKIIEPDRAAARSQVQDCLTALNQALADNDTEAALNAAVKMASFTTLPYSARRQLAPLTNGLRLVRAQKERGLPPSTVDRAKQSIDDAVSNLNFYLTAPDERERKALNVDAAVIHLPDDITKPTVVKDVSLVVSLGIIPPRAVAKPIASGVYMVVCTLVGVPSEDAKSHGEAYAWANRYATRYLRSEVHNFALTRPDSNGVWFPIMPFAAEAKSMVFPDQARAHHDYLITPEVRQARIAAQRERRLQFEARNRELYAEAESLRESIEDRIQEAKKIREAFVAEFGLPPKTQWFHIAKVIRRNFEEGNESVPLQLLRVRREREEKLEKAQAERSRYVEALLKARQMRVRLHEVEAEIDDKKSEAGGNAIVIPHGVRKKAEQAAKQNRRRI